MKLNPSDTFHLENALINVDLHPLLNGYQRLIGFEALGVYLGFVSATAHQRDLTLSNLETLWGLKLSQVNTAIEALIQVHLIDVHIQKRVDHTHLLIQVKAPLSLEEFLKQDVLGRAFLKAVGPTTYEWLRQHLSSPIALEGYEAYPLDSKPSFVKQWSAQEEAVFQTSPTNIAPNLGFDLKAFLQVCSPIVFPLKKRTEGNLRLIQEIGSVYGISPNRMVDLVGKAYVENEAELNADKLRKLASKETVDEGFDESDPKRLPPVVFLKRLRKGLEPTALEKYLLVKIVSKDGLDPQVLNVLVEHHFNQYQGKINTKVLEETALQWAVKNIRSVEEAQSLKSTFDKPSKSRRVESAMDYSSPQVELTDDQKEAIQKGFKKLK